MATRNVLAVDIGAESGRVMLVRFDGQRLHTEEVFRFANVPVTAGGTLYWDILRLWHDVGNGLQAGMAKAPIDAIGLDTWAVDFALLDKADRLLGNPVHYRDRRTDGMMQAVYAKVPPEEVFRRTGIQMMPINTLYQVYSLVQQDDTALRHADRLLMIADLLYYWLTGVKVNEYSNATTTQLFDVAACAWASELADRLAIPMRLFGEVVMPGQSLGQYEGVPVVLCAQHDTACAVVGVPAVGSDIAYLSSGTWSLLGLELPAPIINAAAQAANVTNEGGYANTIRLLKNIMGLWLVQEVRRALQADGKDFSYDDLTRQAMDAPPLVSLINPDHGAFLAPGEMPQRIRAYCAQVGQPVPETPGALVRSILESLAFKYREVLRLLVKLSGHPVNTLHIIGGGSRNSLLCQMTADATGVPVLAGPVEATALGNAIQQLIALGDLADMAEGRRVIRDSFPLMHYVPQATATWDAAAGRFAGLVTG